MSTVTETSSRERRADLLGQTVLVIGGSSGIGLETARRARAEGADVVLTGRDPERLRSAVAEVGAQRAEAFDATDAVQLDRFFADLPGPVDHVMVTAGGSYYATLADLDLTKARHELDMHVWLPLRVAQHATVAVRAPGTLLFMTGTNARQTNIGLAVASTLSKGTPALIADLALELAPIRVNLIAAGFVDTPLSASLLGEQLERRRQELRDTLPIGRVVGPADVAALAVHLMTNTAVTGATYDIDGGQQLLAGRG
jgi:NAD(P)-dependent dehydrogenase (short-subunit alcohol dehydrogenase family)